MLYAVWNVDDSQCCQRKALPHKCQRGTLLVRTIVKKHVGGMDLACRVKERGAGAARLAVLLRDIRVSGIDMMHMDIQPAGEHRKLQGHKGNQSNATHAGTVANREAIVTACCAAGPVHKTISKCSSATLMLPAALSPPGCLIHCMEGWMASHEAAVAR